jgi:signal peptidase II
VSQRHNQRLLAAILIAAGILLADQVTKKLALDGLVYARPVPVIQGFFDLTLVYNTGAAWGMFRQYKFLLAILAIVALCVLVFTRRHFLEQGKTSTVALGLLFGGIAGNLIDRLLHGHVVDFLSFHLGFMDWPAFNIADSAICVGVGLYLIESFRAGRDGPKERTDSDV